MTKETQEIVFEALQLRRKHEEEKRKRLTQMCTEIFFYSCPASGDGNSDTVRSKKDRASKISA